MVSRTSGAFLVDNFIDMLKDHAFEESNYSVNSLHTRQ